MTPSIVRIAKPWDAPEIWRLFLQMHRENGIFSLSPLKVTNLMSRALYPQDIPPDDTGPRAQIGIIGLSGRLEAVVLVSISSAWYSDDLHLTDHVFYVDPECRASNHANALIDWLKNLADSLGLPLVTGIFSTTRTAAKIRLFDRKFPRIGATYFYPLRATNLEATKPKSVMNGPKDPRKLKSLA